MSDTPKVDELQNMLDRVDAPRNISSLVHMTNLARRLERDLAEANSLAHSRAMTIERMERDLAAAQAEREAYREQWQSRGREIEAYEAEAAALRVDAERYREIREAHSLLKLYLYDDPDDPYSGDWHYKPTPEIVDDLADKLIKARKESGNG